MIFRELKLFWAGTRENNLILTFDFRHQMEDEDEAKKSLFRKIVNEKNADAFKPYQLYTKDLISLGIFGGKTSS